MFVLAKSCWGCIGLGLQQRQSKESATRYAYKVIVKLAHALLFSGVRIPCDVEGKIGRLDVNSASLAGSIALMF